MDFTAKLKFCVAQVKERLASAERKEAKHAKANKYAYSLPEAAARYSWKTVNEPARR